MHRIICTVFFEDPFWIGVWERSGDGTYAAAKTTFGAEPRDAEVLAFVLAHYSGLAFSKPCADQSRTQAPTPSPKRMQREAARMLQPAGAGTKAQQALKSQYETGKQEHKTCSREQRLAEEERKFLLRQEQKKARHRGH